MRPRAGDEVSAAIAALFSTYGRQYQEFSAQIASAQVVRALNGGAAAYVATEFANAEQAMLRIVNAPTQLLVGRSLIGNGVDASVPGQAGGDAGSCGATGAVVRLVLVDPAVWARRAAKAARRRGRRRRLRRWRRRRRRRQRWENCRSGVRQGCRRS
nr:PE domain-containing protein [Mycobacterium kansasii]